MNKGKLFLTSTGLTSESVFQKFKTMISDPVNQAVAIITTASDEKEANKYAQLAKKQFIEIGFSNVDFVDLEIEPLKDLSKYVVIYVCGGNTFKLLKFARIANFKDSILNLLRRDGVYIGVSAGSIIVGPSVESALEIDADSNDVGIEDLTGLNITDLIILPHYSPELENETIAFEIKHHVKIKRLTNSQAILIQNGKEAIIG